MTRTRSDRDLIRGCIEGEPEAIEQFADQYFKLADRVVRHTAHLLGERLGRDESTELAVGLFGRLAESNHETLRDFRQNAGLETYLAVVFRRWTIEKLRMADQ